MKILIIGDGNSVHISNFIKVVLGDMKNINITLLDTSNQLNKNEEIFQFYKENKIAHIKDNCFNSLVKSKLVRKVPKVNSLVYLFKLIKKSKRLGEFDYCLVHFVDLVKVILVLGVSDNIGKVIPIFWGSDLLRNKKINSKVYNLFFQKAYKIIFNTENMLKHFKEIFGDKFDVKSNVVKFPTLSFSQLDIIEKKFTNIEMRKVVKAPDNKLLIMCGHSAFKAEQHSELISSISNCNQSILDQCYFIFPMTYGEKDIRTQQEQVRLLLKKNNIEGQVLTEFLPSNEMLKFIACTDIFISVITTDAFSAVMQENIYSNSVLIYGSWLNYYELKSNNINAHSIDQIKDVSIALEGIVRNIELEKNKVKKNRELISNISSPKKIKSTWQNDIFRE